MLITNEMTRSFFMHIISNNFYWIRMKIIMFYHQLVKNYT